MTRLALVIGVRFKRMGKVYYFDPGELAFTEGDGVIVETVRGIEYGDVAMLPREELTRIDSRLIDRYLPAAGEQ